MATRLGKDELEVLQEDLKKDRINVRTLVRCFFTLHDILYAPLPMLHLLTGCVRPALPYLTT